MALSNTTNVISYSPSTPTTVYPYTYPYFDASDLVVYVTDSDGVRTTLTLGSGITTISPINGDTYQGANITTTASYTSGDTVEVKCIVPLTQEYDLADGATISPTSLNRAFDRTVAQSQQLYDMITDLLVVTNALASLSIEAPDGGSVTTYDPDSATLAQTMDFLATLARAIKGESI